MQIIGHRGARNEAPENTLGGFKYLKGIGITAVEFDVRQLKDSTLVVIHDDNLKRTTGQVQSIYETVLEDLIKHDHRLIWTNWQYNEPTPTLIETLKIIQQFKHIEVEVKAVETLNEAEILCQSLLKALQGLEKNVTITSFDEKILQVLQQQNCAFKRGLLIEEDIKEIAIEKALILECDRIGWMNSLATKDIIEKTHCAGLKVSVWTVNELERAKELKAYGIDGLITDVPQTMKNKL